MCCVLCDPGLPYKESSANWHENRLSLLPKQNTNIQGQIEKRKPSFSARINKLFITECWKHTTLCDTSGDYELKVWPESRYKKNKMFSCDWHPFVFWTNIVGPYGAISCGKARQADLSLAHELPLGNSRLIASEDFARWKDVVLLSFDSGNGMFPNFLTPSPLEASHSQCMFYLSVTKGFFFLNITL